MIPNTDDWALLPELITSAGDLFVDKTANDSFYKTSLHTTLSQLRADHIYITGSATDYCVDATVKAALSSDYEITVVSDCHTTSSKPKLPASTLIDHYNSIWSSLTPTKHKLKVLPASDIVV